MREVGISTIPSTETACYHLFGETLFGDLSRRDQDAYLYERDFQHGLSYFPKNAERCSLYSLLSYEAARGDFYIADFATRDVLNSFNLPYRYVGDYRYIMHTKPNSWLKNNCNEHYWSACPSFCKNICAETVAKAVATYYDFYYAKEA